MPTNYADRDREGIVTFYVPLWIRKSLPLQVFDDYWRNVHGPLCARLPGQYQYWQLHIGHNLGGIWPSIGGVNTASTEAEQFDGIAELTFKSPEDRVTWFQAAGILMDDEHNLFSKGIGYNTSPGNSITYVDYIEDGQPNGPVGVEKFHVMIRQQDGVSVEDFRKYLKETFAPPIANSQNVAKFRLHLFDEVDNTRPDAPGVSHYEAPETQIQASAEIGFRDRLQLETFMVNEFKTATQGISTYVKSFQPYPERSVYTFVYHGKMTLTGQRTSTVAELIKTVGALNQLQENVTRLFV